MCLNFLRVLVVLQVFHVFDHFAAAQDTIQSAIWNIPDGELADLSQTFTAGTTLAVSWNAYQNTAYVDTTRNLVYLWVSSFDYNTNPYTDINMTQPGNFAWTIVIPDSVLATSAKYVLRFKLPTTTFDFGAGELSSPGFLILRPNAESSTSTTTSSSSSSPTISLPSPTTSSIIPPSTTSGAPSTNITAQPAPASQPSSPGISSGAKAGIGIGVGFVVLAFVGVVAWILFRRRKRSQVHEQDAVAYNAYEPGKDNSGQYYAPTGPAELASSRFTQGGMVAELPAHTR